jgi:hypothetical protein
MQIDMSSLIICLLTRLDSVYVGRFDASMTWDRYQRLFFLHQMLLFMTVCLFFGLTGCQSVQDISMKKLADNTYQVTVLDETDQAANNNALAMASNFCQRLGMQSQTMTGESSVLQGVHQFLLTFHCV